MSRYTTEVARLTNIQVWAIFDEHLVRQTNQVLRKMLPQYPLETALSVTLIWQLKNNPPNSPLKLQLM